MTEPLHVCSQCELIGPWRLLYRHQVVTGHRTRQLTDEQAAAIRDVVPAASATLAETVLGHQEARA